MKNPSAMGDGARVSLIEKLRQIADAKPGDPMPECLGGPTVIVCGPAVVGERVSVSIGANDWGTPLAALAKEAVDALEEAGRRKVFYDDLMADYDRLRADTDAAIKARLCGTVIDADPDGKTIKVFGITYAIDLFKELGMGPIGSRFEIVERADGVVTLATLPAASSEHTRSKP